MDEKKTSCTESLRQLRDEIETGKIDISQARANPAIPEGMDEWGGAGVIVSANPNRTCDETVLLVITPEAPAIAWLMFKMQDLNPVWPYDYSFPLTTAQDARDYIEKNGDAPEGRKALLLHLLDSVLARPLPTTERPQVAAGGETHE